MGVAFSAGSSKKNTENGAAVTSFRFFLFPDNFNTLTIFLFPAGLHALELVLFTKPIMMLTLTVIQTNLKKKNFIKFIVMQQIMNSGSKFPRKEQRSVFK